MFYTAICDSESVFSAKTKEILDKILDEKGIAHCTHCFSSTDDLRAAMRKCDYSLLLLDIAMDNRAGFVFATELRNAGSRVNIIFVSSNAEFALDAYDVFPVSYLIKPVDPYRFCRAIHMCLEKMDKRPGLIIYNQKLGQIMVEYDNILYVESRRHDNAIYTCDDKQYLFHGNFENLCEKLPADSFFRCHRSYDVNLKHAIRIFGYEYTMRNGDQVPISRTLYRLANEKFSVI